MTVNDATRKWVRERAKYLCEYCHYDERHNEGSIQKARRLWMRGGWHPPDEDRRQRSEED